MPALPTTADTRPLRDPPSSQPAYTHSRVSSAFPSLNRPRQTPPSFAPSSQRRPFTSSQQTRPVPRQQAQSQRIPNLDRRYSPPSSQPQSQASQLFGSQSYAQSQSSIQRPTTRPPTSLSESFPIGDMGLPVDRYRPSSLVAPRSAADAYQDRVSAPPKAQKATEILDKIAGLQTWLEEKFLKKEEEDEEFQGALEDRFKGLEDENKDLKERIHELGMGQKVLPTREELSEEINGQLSPALNEFFESQKATLKNLIGPLAGTTADLAASKVKGHMLELQDMARKESIQNGNVENPLITMLNHVATKLTPLDQLATTLTSLSGLPEALEQVAIFSNTMKAMQARMANRVEAPPPLQEPLQRRIQSEISTSQFAQVQEALDEIRKKIVSPTSVSAMPTETSIENGKVLEAVNELRQAVEGLKTTTASTGSVRPDNGVDMEDIRKLILETRGEISDLKEQLAAITPRAEPTVDDDIAKTLRSILDQLKKRDERPASVQSIATPDTGLRPPSIPIQQAMDLSSPQPGSIGRKSGRVVRPSAKASQDPAIMGAMGSRICSDTGPVNVEAGPPIGSGSATGSGAGTSPPGDVFGVMETITSHPSSAVGRPTKKQKGKATANTNPATYTLRTRTANSQEIGSQSTPTSSRNTSAGSVANKAKKRKSPSDDLSCLAEGNPKQKQKSTSNSLNIKKERVRSLSYKPTTRADATKAKAFGYDIIEISDTSEESGGSKNRRNNSSGSGSGSKKGDPTSTTFAVPIQSDIGDSIPAEGSTIVESVLPPESLPPLDSQSLSQTQRQGDTQTGDDFGHGQPLIVPSFGYDQDLSAPSLVRDQTLSVPSLPGYESTDLNTAPMGSQSQFDPNTYISPTRKDIQREDPMDEATTSSEMVDQSLMIGRGSPTVMGHGGNGNIHKRPEPSYRSKQTTRTYGGPQSKIQKMAGGKFGWLDESDDDL